MKKPIFVILVLIVLGLIISCAEKPKTEAHVAHILIMYKGSKRAPAEVVRTKEAALIMAQDLQKRAKDGEDFANLARRHSDCPSKANGGELTPFGRGRMAKAFEDVAFSLKKGEISEVVETDFGYHIIKGM